MLAIVLVYLLSRSDGRSSILMLVLSGVVISAFFTALIALIKFVADSDDKLPAIVFWLMGSFASASYAKSRLSRGTGICRQPRYLSAAFFRSMYCHLAMSKREAWA